MEFICRGCQPKLTEREIHLQRINKFEGSKNPKLGNV